MPTVCPHCGGPFPAMPDGAECPGYRIVGILWGDTRYDTKARLESPPCPNCGKTSVFEY